MNPQEKALLERTLKLAEENNKILQRILRRARWATAWGIIKIVILIVPIIAGYLFLEPYFEEAKENYSGLKEALEMIR